MLVGRRYGWETDWDNRHLTRTQFITPVQANNLLLTVVHATSLL